MPRTLPPRRYVNWWGFKYGRNGDSFTKSFCSREQRRECVESKLCIFCRNRQTRAAQHPHALKVSVDSAWAFRNCRQQRIVRQDIYIVRYELGKPVDAQEITLRSSGGYNADIGGHLSRKVAQFLKKHIDAGWRLLPRWDYFEIEGIIKRDPRGELNPHGTFYVENLIKRVNPIVRSPKFANASNMRFDNHQIFRTLLSWHNMTAAEFARKWGKRPSFIRDLLSGKRDIYKEARLLMYDAFGIPPEWWRNDEPLW